MKKILLTLFVGMFLINLVSASYSNGTKYYITPFYDATESLGVDNSSKTFGATDCSGLCFHTNAYAGFNNSNGSYIIPSGTRASGVYFNFTVHSSTSGKMNISSNLGYNITNDGSFSTNITNMNNLGIWYASQTSLIATTNYQIYLGSRGIADWNNRSQNNTFGLYLPYNIMSDDQAYRINSSEANTFKPSLVVQTSCEPVAGIDWVIDGVNCVATGENIAMGTRNVNIKGGGNLSLVSGTNLTGTGWFNQCIGCSLFADTTSTDPYTLIA